MDSSYDDVNTNHVPSPVVVRHQYVASMLLVRSGLWASTAAASLGCFLWGGAAKQPHPNKSKRPKGLIGQKEGELTGALRLESRHTTQEVNS